MEESRQSSRMEGSCRHVLGPIMADGCTQMGILEGNTLIEELLEGAAYWWGCKEVDGY